LAAIRREREVHRMRIKVLLVLCARGRAGGGGCDGDCRDCGQLQAVGITDVELIATRVG
jgi:hypothetical protein